MSQYQANRVLVEAFKITGVSEIVPDDGMWCNLDGQSTARHASSGMIARYIPKVGDYWVVQEDGYPYLNPKEVFERKYSPLNGAL